MESRTCFPVLALGTALLCASCSTYITPGPPANLATFTDPRVKKAFTARPAIRFPANLAVVRVQAGGYQSESARGYGEGAYSVVTGRDVETDQDVETLSKLRGVGGIVALNRLLLPRNLSSDLDLREAAAKVQANAVLLYTLSTEFEDNNVIPPLTTLSLGLAPNKHYRINSTASAILMDTQTGYIYGALEENALRSGLTIAWGSRDAIEAGRHKAERSALDKLVASFGPFWNRIYDRYHR